MAARAAFLSIWVLVLGFSFLPVQNIITGTHAHAEIGRSKLTQAECHALPGRVFLTRHPRHPRWRVDVIVYLGFFDRSQSIFVDEGLQRLEVSVLKKRGGERVGSFFLAHRRRWLKKIKPDRGWKKCKAESEKAYPSPILEDGQYQALLVSERYQFIGFFRRPGERFLDNNWSGCQYIKTKPFASPWIGRSETMFPSKQSLFGE